MKKLKIAAAMLLALVTLLAVPMSSMAAAVTLSYYYTDGTTQYEVRSTVDRTSNNRVGKATLYVRLNKGQASTLYAGSLTVKAYNGNNLLRSNTEHYEKTNTPFTVTALSAYCSSTVTRVRNEANLLGGNLTPLDCTW